MAKHIQTGKAGEQLAADYLFKKGYQILAQNWRYSRWEVDVIAEKNAVLHFIEVKTRSSKKFGMPEEKVSHKKIQNLLHAAEQYLYLNPQWKRIQFDILSLLIIKDMPAEYFFIEDISG